MFDKTKKSFRDTTSIKRGFLISSYLFIILFSLNLITFILYNPISSLITNYIPGFTIIFILGFAFGFSGRALMGLFGMLIGAIIVYGIYILIGIFFGFIYSKIVNIKYSKILIILLVVITSTLLILIQNRILNGPDYSSYTVEKCYQKENIQERNLCYIKLAESTANMSICDNIESKSEDYPICFRNSFVGSYISNQDISLEETNETCNNLDLPGRDYCYHEIANYWGDETLCNNIQQNDSLKLYCIDLITNYCDYYYCEEN